jgi:hypothetical protein
LTIARNGTVSMLCDLTRADAARIYERLNPQYGVTITQQWQEAGDWMGGARAGMAGYYTGPCPPMRDNDIMRREVFGPSGWDANEVEKWDGNWPKFARIEKDAK